MNLEAFIDTEGGGFSEKNNPLLSIGVYIANRDRQILAKDYFRILPPKGTAVEINPGEWVDAFTGQPTAPTGWKIAAGAIGVNGYAREKICPPVWHMGALGWREACARLESFLEPYKGDIQFWAHNAPFDRRFTPTGWWKDQEWNCTMSALKRHQKAMGLEPEGKLAALRKYANIQVHKTDLEHTALQDAYDCMHGLWALRDGGAGV